MCDDLPLLILSISSQPIPLTFSGDRFVQKHNDIDINIYMGSSSVLVLTGSHSLCNSFVVNQFFFSHQMEKIPFVIHPRSNESNMVEKKKFCLFFISKIYSHVTQKWQPKTGMAIPYCLCWKLLHTR